MNIDDVTINLTFYHQSSVELIFFLPLWALKNMGQPVWA
jgi:hypothetical protein